MTRKTADASTQAAQAETATATHGAGAAPAVASAPPTATPSASPARDEYHGHGGLYRRSADGTRTLIARTKTAATAPADPAGAA